MYSYHLTARSQKAALQIVYVYVASPYPLDDCCRYRHLLRRVLYEFLGSSC